jgi:hypothetical protein
MSISQLLQPNNYNLFGKSLNGITTEEISGSNENGQVLTIVDKNEKKVAFVDAPSGIPDTVGFPDGYVLKIVDNTTNQVNWEPDIGGGAAVPFILTGDSVNALKVQTSTLEPMIRVDTVDREVHLSGIRNVVEGSDDEKKFSVVNSADPLLPVFNVDTLNTKIEVNNGLTKNGEIVLLNTPETLIPGVDSAVNMKLQYDAGGAGDTNFVGYVAKNGPNALYSLVNNTTAGIYFLSDTSAGIQTTAQELNISSPNPIGKLSAIFNQEISLEANNCELNVGEGNLISMDSKVVIKGSDDEEKFVVKDNLGNNIFQVATNGDSVFIGGNQNSGAKLSIFDPFFNLIFLVDTNNNSLVMGNGAITPSEIYLRPTNGLIELVGSTPAIFQSTIRASHNTNPTGGSVQMSAYRDNTDYNKIESTGALGLLIISDSVVNISGATNFISATPTSSFAPIGSTGLCNKSYVDNRVGGLSSGITNSPTAIGSVIGVNQSLNPTSFLPASPSTPANYFKAGQSFSLVMSGNCQFFNGDTFDIKLIATDSLNNVINLGIINIQTPNTGTSVFELEADFTVRSVIGTTANLVCNFDFTYNNGGVLQGERSFTTANIRVDLIETLTTAINYSSANASSTITTGLFILKKVVDV